MAHCSRPIRGLVPGWLPMGIRTTLFLPDPFSRLFLSAHVTNAVAVIDQPMQMGTFICRGYFPNCQALPRVLLTGACWFVLACGLGLPLPGLASLLVIINPSHFDRRCTATSYGFHAMLGRGFLCCSAWVTRTRAWQWRLGLRFADERNENCISFFAALPFFSRQARENCKNTQ